MAADRPQSLALVGAARTGKTSLINGLCSRQCWEGLVDPAQRAVVSLSLRQERPKSDGDVLALIESRLSESIGTPKSSDAYGHVTDRVRHAASAGNKLVLIFDDFEVATQNSNISLALFAYLRSLANNYDVSLLTASCDVPGEACYSEALSSALFLTYSRSSILNRLIRRQPESWSKSRPALRASHSIRPWSSAWSDWRVAPPICWS